MSEGFDHAIPLAPQEAAAWLARQDMAVVARERATLARTAAGLEAALLLLRLRPRVPESSRLARWRLEVRARREGWPRCILFAIRSGLFHREWYRRHHADAIGATDPVAHFAVHGLADAFRPNPFFDPAWYRAEHRLPADACALRHYVEWGAGQLLAPGPLFDARAYVGQDDALWREQDPLGHYLRAGLYAGLRATSVPAPFPDDAPTA